MKYIGGVMLAMAFAQILATTAVLKEILFVVQFILIEIVLTMSFQVLSRDTKKSILELKQLCNLTQAVNRRLIKDVVALKGIMRKKQEKRPESCFEKSNRIVMEALKHKTPARKNGKMISQRNKRNRVKPYEVRPVQPPVQEAQYVDMTTGAAKVQPIQNAMPVKNDSVQKRSESSKCDRGEKAKLLQKTESYRQQLDNKGNQGLASCMREQQYFCTRKKVRGRTVYERLCLIFSAVMKRYGCPIYSKICQRCKPVHGQQLTHYKRLTKFNELIEFYCG